MRSAQEHAVQPALCFAKTMSEMCRWIACRRVATGGHGRQRKFGRGPAQVHAAPIRLAPAAVCTDVRTEYAAAYAAGSLLEPCVLVPVLWPTQAQEIAAHAVPLAAGAPCGYVLKCQVRQQCMCVTNGVTAILCGAPVRWWAILPCKEQFYVTADVATSSTCTGVKKS